MPKKLSIDEIKNRLKSINNNIEIISEEYIGVREPLKFRCMIDGHEWVSTWDSIYFQRSICPRCVGGQSKIFTIEELICSVENINPNIEVLSTKYVNCTDKIRIKCKICGVEYSKSMQNLRKHPKCPSCSKKNGGYSNTLIIDELRDMLKIISPSITLLSGEYKNISSKFECECNIDSKRWVTSWEVLSKGSGCPTCGKKSASEKLKLSVDEVIDRVAKISPNVKIRMESYTGVRNKVICDCLNDGCENTWYPNVGDLFKGTGCPKCAKNNNTSIGVYSISLVENNKQICLETDAIVYIIECWNDTELFYKVGLTTRTTKERFTGHRQMPYEYKIIKEIKTNLYDGIYIENKIIKQSSNYRYTPLIPMGGHTECFTILIYDDEIKGV